MKARSGGAVMEHRDATLAEADTHARSIEGLMNSISADIDTTAAAAVITGITNSTPTSGGGGDSASMAAAAADGDDDANDDAATNARRRLLNFIDEDEAYMKNLDRFDPTSNKFDPTSNKLYNRIALYG